MKPGAPFCESVTVESSPSSRRQCVGCGGPLAEGWPSGHCANCLLFSDQFEDETTGTDPGGRVDTPEMPFPPCSDFARRYRFLDNEPISRGGQAEIYRVQDLRLRRVVALKRLPAAATDAARWRFFAEAQIASQLDHPNFLPIFDAGLDPSERPFYTTILLPGKTLADALAEVPHRGRDAEFKLRRALELLERIAVAMAYAHERGVLHRDLKPGNVLLGNFGEVFIADFGSARTGWTASDRPVEAQGAARVETHRAEMLSADAGSPLSSAADGFPGTPLYCPPETFADPAVPPGPKTDIYALGVILYQLVCGRVPYARPFGGVPAVKELLYAMRLGPPEAVRRLNRSVQRDLAAICEKAMAYDPDTRYATMKELASDLRAFLETRVVQARRHGPLARARKWALRRSRPLALASLVLAGVGTSLAVAYSYKTQKDAARQITHLREAQLAARQGQWQASLDHLERAEQAGYTNVVDLGLQRIDAWTALSESDRSAAELAKLQRLPELGPYRGAVLLHLAEHELFDRSTWQTGLDHARQALDAGLSRADQAFAQGLLADTSPAALGFFQEALRFDAFHHGAHRAGLGLEFLLGEREALRSHLTVVQVLYPDDPSPVFIEAALLALDGRTEEAATAIAPLRHKVNERAWGVFQAGIEIMGAGGKLFSVERLLQAEDAEPVATSPLILNAAALFLNAPSAAADTNTAGLRFAQLPCVKNGLEQGVKGLLGLVTPLLGNSDAAVEKIKAACAAHREALLPLGAAMLLEPRRPASAAALPPFLERQAGLFQMAAEMPSALRQVPRQARFMAALTQVELACRVAPPRADARPQAVANLRWFLTDPDLSPPVAEACFNLARELGGLDLARGFLAKEEELQPADQGLVRCRIELELAAGAFRRAMPLIEGVLAAKPDDEWAQSVRARAARQIRELAEAYDQSNRHVP